MAVPLPGTRRTFAILGARPEALRSWVPRAAAEAALLGAFMGAILATNYALASFPNVKLFDLLVFVAGYALGFRRAAAIAVLSWGVYGTFNPWGPTTLPLLFVVSASEPVYALAGGLLRRTLPPSKLRLVPGKGSLLLGAVAVATTLAYDAATNVYTGVSWAQFAGSSEFGRWVLVALFNPGALWFSAMHVASNVAAFSLLTPALARGAERLKGALRW
ncbi:MAG: hypothetical protein HY535_03915 [Chloroflexi bacterium]|nr:hypothetical protein [Chloroflexota bacterium]